MQSNSTSWLKALHFLKENAELQSTSDGSAWFYCPADRHFQEASVLFVSSKCNRIASLMPGFVLLSSWMREKFNASNPAYSNYSLSEVYLKPQSNCRATVSSVPRVY